MSTQNGIPQKEITRLRIKIFKVGEDGKCLINRPHLIIGVMNQLRANVTDPWPAPRRCLTWRDYLPDSMMSEYEALLADAYPNFELMASLVSPSDFKNKGIVYDVPVIPAT